MPTAVVERQGTVKAIHDVHLQGLSKKTISTDLHSSLPAEFYHSPAIYQLERRAIFSKRWFLVSHQARYRNVGDYVQYQMAGFNYVLVKNKTGSIVGFHNICRHRAFPVVQESSGTARIFSCKYHGWSYDLNGKLAKAPRFTADAVPGFNAADIRLFPIHVHVDQNGFVYVNLDADPVPAVSWEEQYGGLDDQRVLSEAGVNWDHVEYDFTWTKTGAFNWKIMQDNYNECYHCLTAHPDVARTTALDTYYVEPATPYGYIAHFSEPKATMMESASFDLTRLQGRSATHVFPAGHFSPNPGTGFMHMMRSIPVSATTTRQEYDVYKLCTPHATPEAHQRMTKLYQKIVDEDFQLCEQVQRNMERGIFERGPLHPFHEEGVRAFQVMLLSALRTHADEEKAAGREIWKAKPVGPGVGKADLVGEAPDSGRLDGMGLCEKMIGCDRGSLRGLGW